MLRLLLGYAAFFALGWVMSGQIGWERGDSYARWRAHYDHEKSRDTMASIGVCQWAQLAAHCKLVDGRKIP